MNVKHNSVKHILAINNWMDGKNKLCVTPQLHRDHIYDKSSIAMNFHIQCNGIISTIATYSQKLRVKQQEQTSESMTKSTQTT